MSEEVIEDLGTFNLAGVTPFAGGGPQIPHGMPLIGKVVLFNPKRDLEDVVPDGNGGQTNAINAMLKVEITQPAEYAGATRTFFLRFAPFDDSDYGKLDKRRIVTTLVSGGYDEASVSVEGLSPTPQMFRDITDLHVRNQHVVKGGKRSFDEITVITAEVYKEEVDRIAAHGLPDQTPNQRGGKAAPAEATNGAGHTASAGKGGAESGGPSKGLTKGPAKGAGGGAKGLRNALAKG